MGYYYKLKEDGSIARSIMDNDNISDVVKETYLYTDREIVTIYNGSLKFKDETTPADFEPPIPSLEELKTAKLAEVNTWTASKITGGFISNGVRYDSDIEAQTNIQGITLIVNTERFTTDYPHGYPESGYDEDATEKTIHYLTAEEVLMLCADLSNHINKCRNDGWMMKQEVLEATTKEELDSIILD